MNFLVYCDLTCANADIEAELRSASRFVVGVSDNLWLVNVSEQKGGNPIPDQANMFYGKLNKLLSADNTLLITRLDDEYMLATNNVKALEFRAKY